MGIIGCAFGISNINVTCQSIGGYKQYLCYDWFLYHNEDAVAGAGTGAGATEGTKAVDGGTATALLVSAATSFFPAKHEQNPAAFPTSLAAAGGIELAAAAGAAVVVGSITVMVPAPGVSGEVDAGRPLRSFVDVMRPLTYVKLCMALAPTWLSEFSIASRRGLSVFRLMARSMPLMLSPSNAEPGMEKRVERKGVRRRSGANKNEEQMYRNNRPAFW